MNDFRIGHGYDVHALADGLPLRLGGVLIEHPRGCVAHSDGDALIHALCDAGFIFRTLPSGSRASTAGSCCGIPSKCSATKATA